MISARIVQEYEVRRIDGERRVIRVVEVESGPDEPRHEAAAFAQRTVEEIERMEWDREFERQTGRPVS